MSLRAFHIVFVVVTVVLSLYVALWGIREYSEHKSMLALVLAILFSVTGAALVVYGKKVFVKLKELQ